MNHIITRIFKGNNEKKEERGLCSLALGYSGSSLSVDPMRLSAVYRCVEVISDSVAQLPLEPYEIIEGGTRKYTAHPSYYLLSKEPSPNMSRYTFMKSLVSSILLAGNGYAWIKRDGMGNASEILYIPPEYVTILIEKGNLPIPQGISYNIAGIGKIPPRDMIHVINRTGILTVDGPLSQKQGEEIKAKWNQSFGPVGTPNGVAVLPGNMRFSQVTVNPADAQLLETRQYSVVDICRFFGVSPVKCFDLSHSSYSTVEATQLAFLTDTLAPILEKIELEFERKLFREDEKFRIDVRFDTSALLRADMGSRATFMQSLFNMGALSANEVRADLGLPPIDGGDEHFVQVNLQTLTSATQYTTES